MATGKLYLIPTPIGPSSIDQINHVYYKNTLATIPFFLVEHLRTARQFIKSIDRAFDIDATRFEILDKRTKNHTIKELLKPLLKGQNMGVLSEAGCPGIADPGALVVNEAHGMGVEVEPLVGPSSILLALMGSGLNGQSFTFHGYLPIDRPKRRNFIQKIELQARKGQTQLFMEAPYRNNKLLADVVDVCKKDTLLCIASALHTEQALHQTRVISKWAKQLPDLHKLPTIFLLGY